MNTAELRRLIERYHTGDLTPAERADLAQALEDPAARRFFVQDMTLVAALRHTLKVEQAHPAQPLPDVAAPTQVLRPNFLRRAGWLAAAVLLLCAGTLTLWYSFHPAGSAGPSLTANPPRPSPSPARPQVAANQSPNGQVAGPTTVALAHGGVIQLAAGADGRLQDRLFTLRAGAADCQLPATAADATTAIPPPAPFTVQTTVGSVAAHEAKFSVALAPESDATPAMPRMTVRVQTGQVEVTCQGQITALAAGESATFGDSDLPPTLPAVLKGFSGSINGYVIRIDADGFVLRITGAFPKSTTKRLPDAQVKGVQVKIKTDRLPAPVALQLKNLVYTQVHEDNGGIVAETVTPTKQFAPDHGDPDQF